jgi:hypothetical protein
MDDLNEPGYLPPARATPAADARRWLANLRQHQERTETSQNRR